MEILSIYAQALQYPHPGQVQALRMRIQDLAEAPGLKTFRTFIRKIGGRSLADREEFFTRSLDLNPLAAPYVGYQVWGESYRRGEFMARLSQEMKTYDIDLEGELPDHLCPVLRYLSAAPAPLPELVEVLEPAISGMKKSLKENEASNPYLYLLTAIEQAFTQVCKSLPLAN